MEPDHRPSFPSRGAAFRAPRRLASLALPFLLLFSAAAATAAAQDPAAERPGIQSAGFETARPRVALLVPSVHGANDPAQAAETLVALTTDTLAKEGFEALVLPASSSAPQDLARELDCDAVLTTSLTITSGRKSGKGGKLFGRLAGHALGAAFGSAAQQLPVGDGITGIVARTVATNEASRAASSAATFATTTRARDRVVLDLRLVDLEGRALLSHIHEAKAETDGEDVLSALVERSAGGLAGALESVKAAGDRAEATGPSSRTDRRPR